ncbi:unnamed protein product [Penicillium olsonii]|nr:unnamed protein product [Penicillium olsonii]
MVMAGVLRSLSFPQMLDRRDNIAPAHTDTCRWILDLDDFKNWTLQPRGLLWIKGKPGAGKSTLMAFLYNQFNESQELHQPPSRDRGIQLDFFFSARGTELQHTPLGMLRSLLNQLYDSDETVRPPVRKIFEDRCRKYGYGDNHWEWTQIKLEELLADAILESARKHQVMIFVDALDEAGAESARHVATYFHRLTARADTMDAAVKICISCRHYPIVTDAQSVDIIVEAHNRGDIASCIEDVFVDMATRENQEGLKDLTEHLICRADGVFQWIHLLVPSIERKIADCEPFDHIYSGLREVPAGLKEIYVWIIDHAIEKQNRGQSLLLFQWVCLAERPLTVKELRYALATENMQISLSQTPVSRVSTCPESLESTRDFIENDERMRTRIKALSGGLAEVVPSGNDHGIVQVVHQSVNDFFGEKGFGLLSSHTTARIPCLDHGEIFLQCQAILYRTCLLSVATYAQSWDPINDPIGERESFTMEDGQEEKFFGYATEYLFTHAKKAEGCRMGILKNEVNILQPIVEYWVQVRNSENYPWNNLPGFVYNAVLLHVAATYDLVDIIESLLEAGEHIDATDYMGNTPLHCAAKQGHVRACKILCERGANCQAKNDFGSNALYGAAAHGNLEVVEWLLHQQAVAGMFDEKADALIVAANRGDIKLVKTLLDSQADVNAHTDTDSLAGLFGNCLEAAANAGHVEIVQILLSAHADANAQGGFFGNCLQAAACGGRAETVRLLLDAHADVNAQGGKYGNCLQAAAFEGHIEIVRILLDAQADANAQDGPFGSCLLAAVCSGRTEIVRILLDTHADVNAQNDRYGNALQAATVKGQTDIVRMLLAVQANVEAQGGKYENAIQAAILEGQTDILRILSDVNVDFNAQGGKYQWAIMHTVTTHWNS